jgi:hypothetical protein
VAPSSWHLLEMEETLTAAARKGHTDVVKVMTLLSELFEGPRTSDFKVVVIIINTRSLACKIGRAREIEKKKMSKNHFLIDLRPDS